MSTIIDTPKQAFYWDYMKAQDRLLKGVAKQKTRFRQGLDTTRIDKRLKQLLKEVDEAHTKYLRYAGADRYTLY